MIPNLITGTQLQETMELVFRLCKLSTLLSSTFINPEKMNFYEENGAAVAFSTNPARIMAA
jgi:hypothetical protein